MARKTSFLALSTAATDWHKLYFFLPISDIEIDACYDDFTARWMPILDVFQAKGVHFGLEVHPTEIAYDILSFEHALVAVNRPPMGS